MSIADFIHENTRHTERLALRELSAENTNQLFTRFADEDIMCYYGINKEDDLLKLKERFHRGMSTYRIHFRNYLLFDRENKKLMGFCGFHTWWILHHRAEIGYHLEQEEDKGKGYMTEALQAIIQIGKDELHLHRIEALVGTTNIPSQRLLKRCGFKEEGLLHEHYLREGVWEDSLVYGLLVKA